MPERPLLILPTPGAPVERSKLHGGGQKLHLPDRGRQQQRLAPRFERLSQAFERRGAEVVSDPAGLAPEEVVVLETAGTVEDFVRAVQRVEGLEWLAEIDEDGLDPDDDFHRRDRADKTLKGRLYLVFSDAQAMAQLVSLWRRYLANQPFERGFTKWRDVFAHLRDVRYWDVQDRLEQTGVLDDWRERVALGQETVTCEIELWYRDKQAKRAMAIDRVSRLLAEEGGRILRHATIEAISYDALLAEMPIAVVQRVFEDARSVSFVRCEQVQFFRATGQMAVPITAQEWVPDHGGSEASPSAEEPIVALFDGLPLQKHRRLDGHLIIDDPDGYEATYGAAERQHGTAMASLIVHGDLDGNEAPLNRRIYVRPIMRPDPKDFRTVRCEAVPADELVVDVLHRAVHRLYEPEGGEPPAAPSVRIINLSVCIRGHLFDRTMSPLARLLDWLSWKYRVLFVVSAGNHPHEIKVALPQDTLPSTPADVLQRAVLKALMDDGASRRLLSPAEAMNAVTVGSSHSDCCPDRPIVSGSSLLVDGSLASPVSAQGHGYRRAIKPDVLAPGGRTVFVEKLGTAAGDGLVLQLSQRLKGPGQRVACPGATAGDLAASAYTCGTSNAAALVTRAAAQLFDVVSDLRGGPGGALIDTVPRALWLKLLVAHSAGWGDAEALIGQALGVEITSDDLKDYLMRLLGYGTVDAQRTAACTPQRATAVSAGELRGGQSHLHQFPLPPSLNGKKGRRRLTVTLAWMTPVTARRQEWRRAQLWFEPRHDVLAVDRQQAQWQAVKRGTVQHEVLEGARASAYAVDANVEVKVNCRAIDESLEEPVPYALAISLEVDEEIGIVIYDEIRERVMTRVQVTP